MQYEQAAWTDRLNRFIVALKAAVAGKDNHHRNKVKSVMKAVCFTRHVSRFEHAQIVRAFAWSPRWHLQEWSLGHDRFYQKVADDVKNAIK